jgi:hypothetical protein
MAMAGVPHGVHVICKFKPVLAVEGDCEKGGDGGAMKKLVCICVRLLSAIGTPEQNQLTRE